MPRSVRFTISRDGTVETEFTGFPDEECLNEAEALKSVLKKFGLKVGPQKIAMKLPDQIDQELGVHTAQPQQKERAKVGYED